MFGNIRPADRVSDRALQDGLVEVMPAAPAGLSVYVDTGCREAPLPSPFPPGFRVLPSHAVWHFNPSCAVFEIPPMLQVGELKVLSQVGSDFLGQQRHPILSGNLHPDFWDMLFANSYGEILLVCQVFSHLASFFIRCHQ